MVTILKHDKKMNKLVPKEFDFESDTYLYEGAIHIKKIPLVESTLKMCWNKNFINMKKLNEYEEFILELLQFLNFEKETDEISNSRV